MEENQSPMFEEDTDQAKTWIQENLRIIVSVFIVAAIALGIYSYSQRTQEMSEDGNGSLLDGQSEMTEDENGNDEEGIMSDIKDAVTPDTKSEEKAAPELSKETEASFVERAEKGDGSTHLARRALAHYLEKNPDSSLTAEHKVYIEDYLRKNVDFKGSVTESTSIEFSKSLINQGIEKSKTLNEHQLQNLKKYSARVSAYR